MLSELRSLKEALHEGLVTEEEHTRLKQQVLNKFQAAPVLSGAASSMQGSISRRGSADDASSQLMVASHGSSVSAPGSVTINLVGEEKGSSISKPTVSKADKAYTVNTLCGECSIQFLGGLEHV
ncbi:MAG: hypothetical protein SGPRY_004431 [Prymnesium sp.]